MVMQENSMIAQIGNTVTLLFILCETTENLINVILINMLMYCVYAHTYRRSRNSVLSLSERTFNCCNLSLKVYLCMKFSVDSLNLLIGYIESRKLSICILSNLCYCGKVKVFC